MPKWSRRVAAFVVMSLVLAACGSSKHAATPASTTAPRSPSGAAAPARPSAGCKAPAAGTAGLAAVKRTLTIDGVERYYLLSTPATDATTPQPLLFDLHGLAEGAQIQSIMSEFGTIGAKNHFVVVEPNGTGSPVHWDASPTSNPNHDFHLITTMLDTLEAELCIDTARIYATGLSYGAFMTSALACAMSDRFAAFAPVAGVMRPNGCQVKRPVPMLVIHGTGDPILKFNGGVGGDVLAHALGGGPAPAPVTTQPADLNGAGYPATVAAWAKHNGCTGTPTDAPLGKETIHRVYHCPAGADVEFYIVKGGGHSWPGSKFSANIDNITGHTTFDFRASDVIWNFLKRFSLPA